MRRKRAKRHSSRASSPDSLQSASMSESESESEAYPDQDDIIFPLEQKYYSEADKAEIMNLPEIEREQILAERAQVLERKLQDQHLRRLLQAREKTEAKAADKKKRKAARADLDESQRKSTRQKTTIGGRKVGESSGALEEYKRQREQRGIHNEQRRRDDDGAAGARKRRGSSARSSDKDADGESVEWDDERSSAGGRRRSLSAIKDEGPAELRDFERVRVGRTNFGKVCLTPGFEAAITGCFVRTNVGPDKSTGENVYRMAQVKGFTTGKPYALEGGNGKSFVTEQYAILTIGKSQRDWPFLACSDAQFSEAELERYKKTLLAESFTIPTKSFLNKKIDDINSLLNHRWTDEEISEKLRRSGATKSRFAVLERNAIINRRREAVAREDEAAIAQCDAELQALEGPKLAFGTSLIKPTPKPTGPSQQERLAALNRANRKANTEDIRRAQLAERRAEARQRAAVARGEALANPFARVKTRAKIMYDVNEAATPPDRSKTNTPLNANGGNIPKPANNIPKNGHYETVNGKKVWRPLTDDEVIASFDLGIDIDI
ncbi:plus-3-domain-containing protein [Xylona heveae TC161]|uniref:Plus-3-domain-containing protein n=1 Tax=Xylona heveae (strain CBS 132557 / TC161) TaxID=1328760 RepID=A0A164ZFX0_XYLHT|nr:plus-3-domain-containing protein [Xylona heveae TC161]KZF19052.1 plus-3-domain-containing protein [Xylona heveae TC161]